MNIGLMNSPEALGAQCGGKEWDEDEEEWKLCGLNDEADRILHMTEGKLLLIYI